MTFIIDPKPSKEVIKEKICRHCGITLGYVPNDVKEDYISDYTGDKDYYKYVTCPGCTKQVKV